MFGKIAKIDSLHKTHYKGVKSKSVKLIHIFEGAPIQSIKYGYVTISHANLNGHVFSSRE